MVCLMITMGQIQTALNQKKGYSDVLNPKDFGVIGDIQFNCLYKVWDLYKRCSYGILSQN